MMKFAPRSLRLRFILGTALGLVLISMIYATVTVIGLNAIKLRSTRQQMAQEIELFMTFVDIKQGNLIVNAPEGRLRKKNFCVWLYSTDDQLLWTSNYLPSFIKQIPNRWLAQEGLYEIETPTPLKGSLGQDGKGLPPATDNLLTPFDQYTYTVVVAHYGKSPILPALKVVLVDMVPQEKQNNDAVWDTFKQVTILNLFILLPIVWLVAQWSLRPIDRLARAVLELEASSNKTLIYTPPRELTRLVDNLNALLQQQTTLVARYRHALADLAHSIKTPLAVLQSSFRTLRAQPELMNEQEPLMQEQISRISQQIGYHLRRVVHGPEMGFNRQIHSVSALLDPLTNALRKVYQRKGVDLHLDISPELTFIGEKNDFLEVMGNIIDNACKYCLEFVEIKVSHLGEQLVIEVSDDGPGVNAARRDQILQRGVRVDTLRPGQGIGLAVAVDILNAYKGRIEIGESALGGAVFRVIFGHQS